MYKNYRKSEPKRVSIYLPSSTYNRLDYEYQHNGASKSRLTTVALNEFFERRDKALQAVKGAEHEACP